MKCPFCDNADTKVIDSRPTEEGHAIRRRRGCEKCGKRFTTYELAFDLLFHKIVQTSFYVIGNSFNFCNGNGSLFTGTNNLMEKEVKSEFIGELVMDELKKVDEVAYVRFASVYRQFTDVNTFIKEIEKLVKTKE